MTWTVLPDAIEELAENLLRVEGAIGDVGSECSAASPLAQQADGDVQRHDPQVADQRPAHGEHPRR